MFGRREVFSIKLFVVQDPDDLVACQIVVENSALDLFQGNRRTLDFKNQFLWMPDDICDAADCGKWAFDLRLRGAKKLEEFPLEANVFLAFFMLAAFFRQDRMVKMNLTRRAPADAHRGAALWTLITFSLFGIACEERFSLV